MVEDLVKQLQEGGRQGLVANQQAACQELGSNAGVPLQLLHSLLFMLEACSNIYSSSIVVCQS
jgi:hypothetical protein